MDCAHDKKEIRKRIIRGGGIQYVEQCLCCGSVQSQALPHSEVTRDDIPLFDETLLPAWYEKQSAERYLLRNENTRAWHEWYDAYLHSDIWYQKRKLVIERAGGICEGCLKAEATRVHHLTYRNQGEEFMFQLVAMCANCHRRYHEIPEGVSHE